MGLESRRQGQEEGKATRRPMNGPERGGDVVRQANRVPAKERARAVEWAGPEPGQ